eukprot:3620873-Pyramimonas_sp.AAC.1
MKFARAELHDAPHVDAGPPPSNAGGGGAEDEEEVGDLRIESRCAEHIKHSPQSQLALPRP